MFEFIIIKTNYIFISGWKNYNKFGVEIFPNTYYQSIQQNYIELP